MHACAHVPVGVARAAAFVEHVAHENHNLGIVPHRRVERLPQLRRIGLPQRRSLQEYGRVLWADLVVRPQSVEARAARTEKMRVGDDQRPDAAVHSLQRDGITAQQYSVVERTPQANRTGARPGKRRSAEHMRPARWTSIAPTAPTFLKEEATRFF